MDAAHPKNAPSTRLAFALTGLAALLLWLALPCLPARLALLPGDETREDLLSGKSVDDAALEAFARSRETALAWRASGAAFNDLALAMVESAERKGEGRALKREALKRILETQQKALARAPANSYGWAQAAYLHLLLDGPSQQAARAFALSLQTNPYEPRLMISRLVMMTTLWDKLDSETQAAWPGMVRATFARAPRRLVEEADKNHFVSLAEEALRDDAESLALFRELRAKKEGPSSPKEIP